MRQSAPILTLFEQDHRLFVERAIAEYRAGRPVFIETGASTKGADRATTHQSEGLLSISVEALEPKLIAALEALMLRDEAQKSAAPEGAQKPAHLILSAARLRRLGLAQRLEAGRIAFSHLDAERLEALALKINAQLLPSDAPVLEISVIDTAALELARLCLISSSVLALPLRADALPENVLRVAASDIKAYRLAQVQNLHITARAPVPLEGGVTSEFVVFRGGEGMRDQVAVIVGKPDFAKPVAVRLHSACLTGDLFGSLKCDCGDQLRGTIKRMAETGGGILLYLDQEGRGNGITNKMRAYKLQSEGWDTYDADEVLGFDLDQRRFDFAALMLTQLGVKAVSVITNNPLKIAALSQAGIDVVADQRSFGRSTAENTGYLTSKRDRAGHMIDFDAMESAMQSITERTK